MKKTIAVEGGRWRGCFQRTRSWIGAAARRGVGFDGEGGVPVVPMHLRTHVPEGARRSEGADCGAGGGRLRRRWRRWGRGIMRRGRL